MIVIFDENSMHGRTIYINDQYAVGDIMIKKPIQANSARDGSSCEAGHPKLVFDLAVERLLKRKKTSDALPDVKMENGLTARIAGSWLRSMGFMTMKTCWFL